MSSPNKTTITCPKCSHRQEFTIWESLNATLDPDKKKLLLDGVLTRFNCSRCQSSCDVAYPMLYHDMERRTMIYNLARVAQPDLGALHVGAMMQGYRMRLVAERNELIEKIHLTDAGIDDRAMELFKVSMRAQMDGETEGELYFSGPGQASGGQPVLYFAALSKRGTNTVAVARESYDEFAEGVTALLEQEPLPPGPWLHINRHYAENLVRKYLPGDQV